jgi:hypothetical protein
VIDEKLSEIGPVSVYVPDIAMRVIGVKVESSDLVK